MGILGRIKRSAKLIHLTYLGGYPDLPRRHIVGVERQGDQVLLYYQNKDEPVARIPISTVKSIKLERASSRSLGGAAVGAIAGGVILGPVGAIAGGALGGRKRKDSVIVVTVQQGPIELEILFGGKTAERRYPKFVQLFQNEG